MSKLILVAEDDLHIARLVSFKLKREGFQVLCVQDGSDVLRELSEHSFDLMLLDVMMPRVDGLEVLQRLPEALKKSMPIIMLSAKSQDQDVLQALQLGAVDYLTKPFDPQDLVDRVRQVLELT
ncbi:response regulator [Candidatus Acetothermia bacterium]|nr:response regulator [Candidatus Acetothermia bacterium]MBI3643134.1 response regulator [Candidatus Acetothermia bacterium]